MRNRNERASWLWFKKINSKSRKPNGRRMSRKKRRGLLIASGVTVLAVALILVMFAMRDGIAYFYTPSDLTTKVIKPGQRIRLGGLVKAASVKRGDGTKVYFSVTDTIGSVPVVYDGVLPDLFREGQGVVAEGRLAVNGTFMADTVLAKHDENYMPANVAKALKAKGVKLGKNALHPAASPSVSSKPKNTGKSKNTGD